MDDNVPMVVCVTKDRDAAVARFARGEWPGHCMHAEVLDRGRQPGMRSLRLSVQVVVGSLWIAIHADDADVVVGQIKEATKATRYTKKPEYTYSPLHVVLVDHLRWLDELGRSVTNAMSALCSDLHNDHMESLRLNR